MLQITSQRWAGVLGQTGFYIRRTWKTDKNGVDEELFIANFCIICSEKSTAQNMSNTASDYTLAGEL